MRRWKFVHWLVVLSVVASGVALVTVTRTIVPLGNRPNASPTSPPVRPVSPESGIGTGPVGGFSDRPHMFPVRPDPMDEALRADQAKPRYKGLLGDFFVDWSRVAEYPPCSQPLKPLTLDITTHELYAPGFRVAFPVEHFEGPARECADGSILAMGLSPFVGRRYYVGPAVVPWNAPLDRLVLMTVVGHPAIGLLGIPGWPDMFELFVIQRFPSGTKPGILVIVGRTRTLDEAVTKAEWIIKIGNE